MSLLLCRNGPGRHSRGRLGRVRPASHRQRHDALPSRSQFGEDQILRRISVEQPPKASYIIAYYQLFHLAALAGIARAVLKDALAFTQAKTSTFGVPGKSSPRHDPLVQSVIGRLASLSFTVDPLVDGVAAAIHEAYRRLH